MADLETITVTFHHTKETKRMHRYEAIAPEDQYADILGSIYISKPKLKGKETPTKIEIQIKPVNR